jgi:hypothetical protein
MYLSRFMPLFFVGTAIVSVPPMAAMFFQGTLRNFLTYSAFGGVGSSIGPSEPTPGSCSTHSLSGCDSQHRRVEEFSWFQCSCLPVLPVRVGTRWEEAPTLRPSMPPSSSAARIL